MRHKPLFLILLAAAATLAAVGTPLSQAQSKAAALPAGWTTPVNISNLGGWSEAPTIAVDENGRVYASWTEWYGGVGSPRAMVFNSTNAAGQWGTPQESFLGYPAIDDVGFPTLACTPTTGKALMGYHDADFSKMLMGIYAMLFEHGKLGGETFVPGLNGAASYVTIAYNPADGKFYLIFQYDAQDTITFEFAQYSFDPATGQWNPIGLVHGLTGSSRYWPRLAFDGKGTAHLLFINRSPAVVYYCKNATPSSADTWTAPINLSGDTARDWVSSTIAADNDGDVYVAWYGNTGGYESATEEVWFRKTVNGVWTAPLNLTNNPLRSEGPSVAVNPTTKDIYVAYHEDMGGNQWEVMLKSFDQATQTWSQPVNFTNNPGHDGEPCIRVDKTGGLHLAYHYTQTDGNQEIYYTMKPGIVKPQPPTAVALTPGLNSDKTKKVNTLTWTNNPANANLQLSGNKIWRKLLSADSSAWAVLTTVSPTAIQYLDANLDILTKYSYGITVAPQTGEESEASSIVSESAGRQFDLPPTNVAVSGGINKVLFYREKRNTITWAANPGNPAADVSGFEVYRKETGQPDSSLALIGTVSATTLTYTDAKLSTVKYFSYAVKTKFSDGKTSDFSAVVPDRATGTGRGGR